jgi:hypothetical protein
LRPSGREPCWACSIPRGGCPGGRARDGYDRFALDLPVGLLLEAPTVADLAAILDEARRAR